MIVDCAIYDAGVRRPGTFTFPEAFEASKVPGTFVWLGLHEPTAEEFAAVRSAFSLHELAVEDALKAHQRPKLEVYDDTLFLVLKTARYVDREEVVDLGEILLFVGATFLVAVRHGAASPLGETRKRVEKRPERHEIRGVHGVDSGAHDGGTDHRPFGQKIGEIFRAEAGKPRPQPQVGRVGGLCLKSGQVPERLPRRERVPAQQELAVERGAVQGALAQPRAICHAISRAAGSAARPTCCRRGRRRR